MQDTEDKDSGTESPEKLENPNPCVNCMTRICRISGVCNKRKIYTRYCKAEGIDFNLEDQLLGVVKPWLKGVTK